MVASVTRKELIAAAGWILGILFSTFLGFVVGWILYCWAKAIAASLML